MTPMASAPIGPANPEAGVIATSPATAPVAIPRTLGLPYLSHSTVIQLHFHDLRREFAYTLLESEADLHDVRVFLGHANITTTSRYLASSPGRIERALARLEERALGAPAPYSRGTPTSRRPLASSVTATRMPIGAFNANHTRCG